jgi:hypothetical protein
MLGHNWFGAMITPDSQSLARLPCPIYDDNSGWRRGSPGGGATGLVAGQEAGAVLLVVAARALAAHNGAYRYAGAPERGLGILAPAVEVDERVLSQRIFAFLSLSAPTDHFSH